MKLRNRLYLILLTISLVPLILCGVLMLYQNNRNLEGVIEENLLGVSESQIDNIESFFENIKQNMEIISNFTFLKREVQASLGRGEEPDEVTRAHLEDILIQRMEYQPYIQSMVIADKNLRIVAASEDYVVGADSKLGLSGQKVLTGAFRIGNVYTRKTEDGDIRAVLAYIGIFDDGELIGYLAEEILLDYFSKYHDGNVFWDNGVMIIRDEKKAIVTIGGMDEDEPDFIQQQEKHDQKIENERIKRGFMKEGAVKYTLDGNTYIAQYAGITYTDWTIRISANVDSYMKIGISYAILLLVIMAVGLLMMHVMNHYVTVKTVRPMEEIREVLKEVQQTNDYTLRLKPASDDEVGELQHEVNRLLQCVMELQMQGKEEQKSLEKQVSKDPLTGIMNKKAIVASIQKMTEEAGLKSGTVAVGFLDIDNFRDYNTKYGHTEGDHVIKFIAHTLREIIPGSVGRNGGDEFVFCMETDGKEFVTQTMELLKHRLHKGVINGVTGENMPIPCSIGIVVERAGKTDYLTLIQEADEAMYQAKEDGKDTYYIRMK